MTQALFQQYLAALRTDFTKLAKLEFLNEDGSVAFALDNNPRNRRAKAFLQEGSISCNLNNGRSRQADVTLANLNGEYEYAVNKIWFGQELRLSEGLILPNGQEYYIPQGIFLIENPTELLSPGSRTASFKLVDKWANLDGSLLGNLESAYSVGAGTDIFQAMAALLRLGRYDMAPDSRQPIDPLAPIFTGYYNGKTQKLTDGRTVQLTAAPYDFRSADSGTLADVLLGLAEMLAAWIGYNPVGRLVVDPSQEDILDSSKPVLWNFRQDERQLVNLSYASDPSQVFNDIIVVGAAADNNATARGRAQNLDPASDSCISRIGLKTKRIQMPNYYSNDICEAYADWQLKRSSVVARTVTIECTQMFHITENAIVSVLRTDKPGSPVERHIVQSFTRPLGQTGTMSIDAISVNDYPVSTLVKS